MGLAWNRSSQVRSDDASRAIDTGADSREAASALARRLVHEPAPSSAAPAGEDGDAHDSAIVEPAAGCAVDRADHCPFLKPDRETLTEMARCGIVRYEIPAFLEQPSHPVDFDEAWLEEAAVTQSERRALEELARAFRARLTGDAAELAVEAGLDREWADQTPFVIVIGMVQSQLDPDAHAASLQAVAQQRADGQSPVTGDDLPLADRAAHLLAGSGDAWQAEVATRLGPERARELREASDGWPGRRSSLGNRCAGLPAADGDIPDFRPTTPAEARACLSDWEGSGCGFLDPSEATREEMARCGIVRFDFPSFLMTRGADPGVEPAFADALAITPEETAAIAEVGDVFRGQLYEELESLAVEIGKSPEWAEQTPMMGIMAALQEEVDDGEAEIKRVFADIARERAGLPTSGVPADPSVNERVVRRMSALGTEFERALAERLGTDRAQQLRAHGDGWSGPHVQTHSQCDPDRSGTADP